MIGSGHDDVKPQLPPGGRDGRNMDKRLEGALPPHSTSYHTPARQNLAPKAANTSQATLFPTSTQQLTTIPHRHRSPQRPPPGRRRPRYRPLRRRTGDRSRASRDPRKNARHRRLRHEAPAFGSTRHAHGPDPRAQFRERAVLWMYGVSG